MDTTRRTLLTTGAAAVAAASAPRAFAQATGKGDTAKPFFQKGDVRIHYQDAGSGFPLLIIPGGGQNSTIAWAHNNAPFNAIEALNVASTYSGSYRERKKSSPIPTLLPPG